MNKQVRVRLDTFRRVQEFGEAFATSFPEGSAGARALAKVAAAFASLQAEAAARVARQRSGRDQKPPARQALLLQLDEIARTAQIISRTTPGFAEPFALSRPRRDDVLVASAQAYLRDAAPLTAHFTERGLPSTFLDDLQRALAAFQQALAARAAGRLARAAARGTIREAEAAGMAAIEELDVIVSYRHSGNAAMQAGWTTARRLDRVPQTGGGGGGELGATTTPAAPSPVNPSPASADASHGTGGRSGAKEGDDLTVTRSAA